MKQEDQNIFRKYLKGIASVDEQARIEKKLTLMGEVPNIKGYVKNDWNEYLESNEIVEKDMSSILDRIHHVLHIKEVKLRQTISHKIYKWSVRVAAIIAVPLLIASVILSLELGKANNILTTENSVVRIDSPIGSKLAFSLPDGTVGMLNGGSSIEYSIPFTNNRKVKLRGEGYFDVEFNEEYPFVVFSNSIEVKVIGTRFNFYAYPDVSRTEVILEEGKVECFVGKSRKKITMIPNERITLSENKITKSQVNAAKFTAWKDGKLIFHGDLMDEVASRLERWYDVSVEIADSSLLSYSFRGTFENDSLEEVLRLLKMTSPLDYKIVKRIKLSDGSFSKKKIFFYKSNGH